MSYYRRHVFFCCNQREPPEACCANHGALDMQAYAKQAKDTEAAVNLGISTKRLLSALDEAEKL